LTPNDHHFSFVLGCGWVSVAMKILPLWGFE